MENLHTQLISYRFFEETKSTWRKLKKIQFSCSLNKCLEMLRRCQLLEWFVTALYYIMRLPILLGCSFFSWNIAASCQSVESTCHKYARLFMLAWSMQLMASPNEKHTYKSTLMIKEAQRSSKKNQNRTKWKPRTAWSPNQNKMTTWRHQGFCLGEQRSNKLLVNLKQTSLILSKHSETSSTAFRRIPTTSPSSPFDCRQPGLKAPSWQ